MAKKTTKKTTRRASTSGKKVAKAPARKTTKKTAKKPATRAAASKPARIASAAKPRTKTEVIGLIAEHVGISKKEVGAVFETMGRIIEADLKKGKAEAFTVPGLMKVTVQRKPATRARKGINPFTGEETTFKAKPARNVVKVRPMKGLKDLV